MALFALRYTYDPAIADRRAELLGDHRAWLQGLKDRGELVDAGVYPDGTGSLLLLELPDLPSASATVAEDPFAKAGLVAAAALNEWGPRWGVLAERSARS